MEELLIVFGVFTIVVVVICAIHIVSKNEEEEQAAYWAREAALQFRKKELMRPNLMRHYEEKKQEGLAELDKWCRQYNMTIHQMKVFLGLMADNTKIIEKMQDIEDAIYAPRVGVAIRF